MNTKTTFESLTEQEIKDFLKQQKQTHFYKRIQFVQYKKEGLTHEKIAALLNVCLKTVSNWRALFSEKGMPGLVSVSYDRRDSKLCDIEKDLRKKIAQGEIPTQSACKQWLEEEKDIAVGLSAVGWFLKKNGLVLQKDQASSRRHA